jgi:phytoene dehydrogenase-like protein
LFALARAMRAWWWEAVALEDASAALRDADQRAELDRMKITSATAYLNGWFETDALKALLAADACEGAPSEAGSALLLLWRAAQEMCGLQGVTALPRAGTLISSLTAAAQEAGAEIRTGARVAQLILADGAMAGVVLESGENISAPVVLSALSRRATLLDLAPTASAGIAGTISLTAPRTAHAIVLLSLNAPPQFRGPAMPSASRFVFTDRLETYAAANAAARAGRIPDELVMEAMLPSDAPGQNSLRIVVRNLPAAPREGWDALRPLLLDKVVAVLESHAPGLKANIAARDLRIVADSDPTDAARLLAPGAARTHTPIDGLFLCGAASEPADAVSGRGARFAAAEAIRFLAGSAP